MAEREWTPGQPWPFDNEAPAVHAGEALLLLVRRSRRSGAWLAYFRKDDEIRYVRLRNWIVHVDQGTTPDGRRAAGQH